MELRANWALAHFVTAGRAISPSKEDDLEVKGDPGRFREDFFEVPFGLLDCFSL